MAINGRFSLEGKTAIVTGNGSGLGRAMSLALADAGANIVGAGRRPDPLLETQGMIEAKGRRALAVPTDVTQSEQVNALVERAVAEFGRIDILINNAGGGGAGRGKTMPELTDEDWHDGIDTNLTSAFFCSRAIVPHFLEHGGGRIINVTSGWGMRARRGEFMYAISKGGVIQLTKTIAMTYARDNIRCTCIAPGSIPKGLDEEVRKERSQLQPVGRLGYSYEVGPLAVFLASQSSDYMTGETVLIVGGAIAGGLVPAGIFPQAEG